MNSVKIRRPVADVPRQALVGTASRDVPGGKAMCGVIERARPKSACTNGPATNWDDWLDGDEHSDAEDDDDDGG